LEEARIAAAHRAPPCRLALVSRPSRAAASSTSARSWPTTSDGRGLVGAEQHHPVDLGDPGVAAGWVVGADCGGEGPVGLEQHDAMAGWVLVGVRHHRQAAQRAPARAAPVQVAELPGRWRVGRAAPGPNAGLVVAQQARNLLVELGDRAAAFKS